jgi:signal peptidase II
MYFRPRNMSAEAPMTEFLPWLVTMGQEQMGAFRVEMTSFFDRVRAWNTGVSFSLISSAHAVMPSVLSGVGVVMALIFFVWMMMTRSLITALPLALIIAGALSNVWDRLRFGAVADFLYFHIGKYGWPAFNIADSCIVAGVAFLAFDSLFLEPRRERLKAQTA